ncbi:hypothetical protein [Streptomyces sp. NPDC006691]|uniref:hypothetical protein n=1 Tax=Streptomyces sp. NPDC006691 TaxID=3364757 RepID=UPI00369451C4
MSTAEVKSATGPDPDEVSRDAGRAQPAQPAQPDEAGPEAVRAPGGAPRDEPAAAPGQPAAPRSESSVPPGHPAAPRSEEAARPSEAAAPRSEEAARPSEAAAPRSEEAAPPGEAAAPRSEEAAPPGEPIASLDEGPAPLDEAPAPPDEAPAPLSDPTAPPAHRLRRVLTLGCVLVLLLAGAGLLFQARQLTSTPATANRALTDASETTRVIGDVSNTLGKVFSYSGQDTSATEQAAKELLSGRAASQFAELYGQLRQRAAEQKLSLTTHVVRAGVTRLTHDRAELLVFLDQRAQRDSSAPTTAAAQLSVTAQLDSGHWQITDIRAR